MIDTASDFRSDGWAMGIQRALSHFISPGGAPPPAHHNPAERSLPAYVFRISLSPSTRQSVFSSSETGSGLCRLQDLLLIERGRPWGQKSWLCHMGLPLVQGRGLGQGRGQRGAPPQQYQAEQRCDDYLTELNGLWHRENIHIPRPWEGLGVNLTLGEEEVYCRGEGPICRLRAPMLLETAAVFSPPWAIYLKPYIL